MEDAELLDDKRIEKVEYSDVKYIAEILKESSSINTDRVVSEILKHLIDSDDNIALKYVINKSIVCVWFSKEFDTHTSLSFFYADESIRRKPDLISFFQYCYRLLDSNKPVIISTSDTTGFSKYVRNVGENLWQFVGFR